MKISLSDGEWKLMNRLWEQEGLTITELTAALREETAWGKHTVITMLSRLEGKGAVRYEEGPRAKNYFAALSREEATRTETKNFLGRVFDGDLGVAMSSFVTSLELTEKDIDELKAILEESREEAKWNF